MHVPAKRIWVLVVVTALAGAVLTVAGVAGTRLLDRRTIFFGLTVPQNDLRRLDSTAKDAGARPSVDNVFVKLDSTTFGRGQLDAIAAAGMQPMLSVEPWSFRSSWGQVEQPDYRLATVSAGAHDAALRRIARAVADYRRPVLVRFAHEMNGWWYPWSIGHNGNSAADYVAAWQHVYVIFRAEGASNARFLWSPNAVTGSDKETPLEAAYPGDGYVDFVGMTAYGHGASPAATFDATYERLTALTGKPVVLSETGADGGAKTTWITQFAPWLHAHARVAGFIWFNTSPATTGASGDYRFDDSPGTLRAFREMLAELPLGAP